MIRIFKKLLNQNFSLKTNMFSRSKFFFIWEICYLRFLYFFLVKKSFKFFEKIEKNTIGVEYSKKSFYDGRIPIYRPDERILLPFFNLLSDPNLEKEKILILGPRYENEIFIARAIGFKKVYALDTFSYSPLVEIGDMHNLEYPEDFFDAIVCGWTLSYSTDPQKACNEMSRVLKKNGSVVVAVEKVSLKEREKEESKKITGILTGSSRIQTKDQFDKLFVGLECVSIFDDKKGKVSSPFIITYKKN